MLSRRGFVAVSAACGLRLLAPPAARAAAVLTDDGLYSEPWFLESFLELSDDLAATTEKKKRFAIMWELRGCPYCKETHLVNFAKPEIENYIRERFEILQLNIVGSREVTDFDGQKLPEKQVAAKYGVRYTPTFQFFPAAIAGLAQKPPREREVARARLSRTAEVSAAVSFRLRACLREQYARRLLESQQLRLSGSYLLTGLSGLMTSATRSLI